MTAGKDSVRRWLEQHASRPYAYLTTIGRKSGRPHRIEIWFAVHDGRMYMLSGGRDRSDWVRNLRANPHVTVELGGQQHPGVARILQQDEAEDQLARRLLVEKYRRGNEIDDWGRNSLPIVVEFEEVS